jgi:hypothetical protein
MYSTDYFECGTRELEVTAGATESTCGSSGNRSKRDVRKQLQGVSKRTNLKND